MPYKHSRIADRRRNRVARLCGHLRNWRPVTIHHDRSTHDHLAAVALVSRVIAWA
ncbi:MULTISPECIES: hypothetical protein [Methylobacterium]|uniref:hypothetical protein n=1 Tax=Methylobacterium TaxID=407 RepID=UPI00034C0793|nr:MULTISPECIES: hypothetical protein [unclassified Methylobacterium]